MKTFKVISEPEQKGKPLQEFEVSANSILGALDCAADMGRVIGIYENRTEGEFVKVSFSIKPLHDVLYERIIQELRDSYKMGHDDFNSRHEAYAVLLEKMDEVWDEAKRDSTTEFLYDEIIKVAAMAMKFLIYIEKNERQ